MHDADSRESAGARLRALVAASAPLLLPGVINGYCARMAEQAGFSALYLSGGGIAAAMGMPDLAVTTLQDVVTDASRITDACGLPLLVDADTGFGGFLNIGRTVRMLTRVGVAGIHLEDQMALKRCGHRPNKQLVSIGEMTDRLRAACDARLDNSFVIMARTDALATESMPAVQERISAYVEAGADMIFLEAARTLEDYQTVRTVLDKPLLANITEFGQTPLFSAAELAPAGVDIVLFPLSAFRAMNKAALAVYQTIHRDGSQQAVVDSMQTRSELYDFLDYHRIEQKMDDLFGATGEEK